ncbi:MAG: Deoxyribodipyrimidine photo-lyase [Chroococcopsis gigantea SAG 12.99]|jgi:deoxyribodipyrimidine photo-lyase|nr:deoxyribodipyrimidine photo-lyase [Chlorogloea purpurea SAG 13.99]MDV3001259.1 Deoxyribodipyrimidine photo-lyase [Chroococcopsis gigantea SAG 12.99]
MSVVLFWHRRDLRLSDNVGLTAARQRSPRVVGVFCLDPHLLQKTQPAPARVAYMLGCLRQLQDSYRQQGGQLLILRGEPSETLPELASALNAHSLFFNLDIEPYGRQRDEKVQEAFKQKGIPVETFWDQLLHAPGDVVSMAGQFYTVYTPFWKNWRQKQKAAPLPRPENFQGLTAEEIARTESIDLPSAKDLGFVWDNGFMLSPGETSALERLEEFCTGSIEAYGEERNFPANDGTSRLSAAMKFGAIGVRTVWDATLKIADNCRSDEALQGVTTWQQELAWREFYQHGLYFLPRLAHEPYRKEFLDFPWSDNEEHFQAWCEGKTGYPIVDAAMRGMNETGWMHNRCRMIVASFLCKDLIINWQRGEEYFMKKLYDGDLSANNGGWQWSASCGMDPKPLRIFNPATQAQKFDADGEYIRRWLPELGSIDTEFLISGKISNLERYRCGYVEPIVDHNAQQREFKRLYGLQKQ